MSNFLSRLLTRKFKKRYYRYLVADILEITKQFDTHIFTFPCNNSVGGRRLYSSDGYNRAETECVLNFVREHERKHNKMPENAVALEFGGHIGTQTVYFALSGLFQKIISVEADADNAKYLQRNVSDNGFSDMVDIKQVVLGDHDGTVSFYKSLENDGTHSLLTHNAGSSAIEVACKCLKTITDESGIDFADVAFIWSDLEGMDYEAFMQVAELGLPSFYYLEFSPHFRSPEDSEGFKDLIFSSYKEVYRAKKNKLAPIGIADIPAHRQTNLFLCEPKQ